MLSVRPDKPVDPLTIAVSREIDRIARDLKLPYFLAGAMARDILLTYVFGIETGLATSDVDFGVTVGSWQQFSSIKNKLMKTGKFTPDEKIEHRIYYKIQGDNTEYPVDIIPFGDIESPPRSLAWPPDGSVIMNVIGYEEVLATATPAKIADDLIVPIASLPGLTVLKLFAWQDRHAETTKDARDLAMLFRHYHAAGNQDRIFGEELPVMEAVDYDLDLASPRLLGKDVSRLASAATLQQLQALLNNEKVTDRLITHMSAVFSSAEDSIAAAARLLVQFKAGVNIKGK
jgi:predicted nucleotidyltransferase